MNEMKYDNTGVRRQDRLLDEDRARELLATAEYGVLSMADEGGEPYGIPVNFVWDGAGSVYVHCAPEGRKLRLLAKNPKVSFCVVGRVCLQPSRFTTGYESVVLTGSAVTGLLPDERHHALELLLRKLSPHDLEVGLRYAEKSFHRTEVIRLDFTSFSGKCKKIENN